MKHIIQQWEKQFLDNASLVFEEAVPVKMGNKKIKKIDFQRRTAYTSTQPG